MGPSHVGPGPIRKVAPFKKNVCGIRPTELKRWIHRQPLETPSSTSL